MAGSEKQRGLLLSMRQLRTKFQNNRFRPEVLTEKIMLGSVNEALTFILLRGLKLMSEIYFIGMVESTKVSYFVCFPHGIALMTVDGAVFMVLV